MKAAFYTLGCKVNHYETEALQEQFANASFTLVPFKTYADVYVINTCTVTNQSATKSRKTIRQAIHKNPDAIVAVIGCYSQLESQAVKDIPGVDIILGTNKREKLLEYVLMYIRDRQIIEAIDDVSKLKTIDALGLSSFHDHTRAFIKIQDGCDRFCSYCIIPYARGPMRSRPLNDVLTEARKLASKGHRELVLTGIHTGGYGKDLPNTTFYDLLVALQALALFDRIRISSIEMNELTDDILELIAQSSVFAKHLHIPLQSGSNRILEKMRRHYTTEMYAEKIHGIRQRMPNIAITTDIIVGYPEESDEDFREMLATIQTLAFSEMHVFPYSKRNGTRAAMVKNQTHGTIKSVRVNEMLKENERLAKTYIQSLTSTPLNALIEFCEGDECFGYVSEYVRVKVVSSRDLSNTMQTVEIVNPDYPISLVKIID